MKVAKTLASAVGLKRVQNDAFRVACARNSCFVMSMFEASGAESVERLHSSRHGNIILRGSFRAAFIVIRLHMPRLNFFVAGAVHLKHFLTNR